MRILLSSPSDAQRAWLGKALTESLNSVEATDDLRFARYLASQESFDAALLCTHGKYTLATLETGLKNWRAQARNDAPVIAVALAHASADDRARVLRAGADACFVQPYSVLEIIERLRALARGAHPAPGAPPGQASDAHDARLDPFTRALTEGDVRVPLTRREYLLLECLLRAAGLPVARADLIRYVWPEKEGLEPSSLNPMILRLRRKLETGRARARVQTVNRYGYRFDASPV